MFNCRLFLVSTHYKNSRALARILRATIPKEYSIIKNDIRQTYTHTFAFNIILIFYYARSASGAGAVMLPDGK